MAGSIKLVGNVTLRDEDWDIEASFTPGTNTYYDKGLGVHLPGDPSELDDIIISREVGDTTIFLDQSTLTKEEQGILDCAWDRAIDNAADAAAAEYEDAMERRRDDYLDR